MGLLEKMYLTLFITLWINATPSAALVMQGAADQTMKNSPLISNASSTHKMQTSPSDDIPADFLDIQPCTQQDWINKDLDLVIYGATGFIGQLVAEYLLQGHPQNPRWAMSGRDEQKLNRLRAGMATVYPNISNVTVLPALTSDMKAMQLITKRAKVILNVAGPFETVGESVIVAALLGCAHYVDIDIETYWKAAMLKKFSYSAETRGIAIVLGAGFSSGAADFLALSAAQDFTQSTGSAPSTVAVVWTKLNSGGLGGGSKRSVRVAGKHGVMSDPYILAPWIPAKLKMDSVIDGVEDVGFEQEMGHNVQKFFFGLIDPPVIRNTLSKTFPTSHISVRESQSVRVLQSEALFLNDPKFLRNAPPINPEPGDGSPKWIINGGAFAGQAIAIGYGGAKGRKVTKVILEGQGDPATKGTAKIAIEVAMSIALQGFQMDPGYNTPARAAGISTLERRFQEIDLGRFMSITHEQMNLNY